MEGKLKSKDCFPTDKGKDVMSNPANSLTETSERTSDYAACKLCHKLFTEQYYLDKHLNLKHSIKTEEKIKEPNKSSRENDNMQTVKYENNSDNSITLPDSKRTSKPMKCQYCQKYFIRKQTLQHHILVIHEMRKETCNL